MKKIFSLILALCLLCGAVALADAPHEINGDGESVDVPVQLEVSGAYWVTIPAAIQLDGEPIPLDDPELAGHVYFEGESILEVHGGMMGTDFLQISIGSDIAEGDGDNPFVLHGASGDPNAYIGYRIDYEFEGPSEDDNEYPYLWINSDINTLQAKATYSGSFKMIFRTDSETPNGFIADTYTDTLTFTISESDTSI